MRGDGPFPAGASSRTGGRRAGHLPGAQSVSPENLRASSGGVPAALYPPKLLDAIFARAGLDARARVVRLILLGVGWCFTRGLPGC